MSPKKIYYQSLTCKCFVFFLVFTFSFLCHVISKGKATGLFSSPLFAQLCSPTLYNSYDTPDSAVDVYVLGDKAYVADWDSGLQIIDVSNPATPTRLGYYNMPLPSHGVYTIGNTAYVAADSSGLQIIDVSSPSAPTLHNSYNTPSSGRGVYVVGDTAYVADGWEGLQIIDVSNPTTTTPTRLGFYDTPGFAEGVYVIGDTAYVADWTSGLQIIDVSDPAAPTGLGSYDTQIWNSSEVYVIGDTAYVADSYGGLQIIDVSDPAVPSLHSRYDTQDIAYGVFVSGNTAYVANGPSGLMVIDVSDPAEPFMLGSYDTPGEARGIYVLGDTAYVADNTSGLQIMDVSACGCAYTVSPTDLIFGLSGGTSSASVTVPLECSWTATSNASWIRINSGSSGSGDGMVHYTVLYNSETSATRTGTITIAGKTFTVTQTSGCTYFLSPPSLRTVIRHKDLTDTGFTVRVYAPGGCSWTTTIIDSWIELDSSVPGNNGSGSGNGKVVFNIPFVGGALRTGSIIIAGQQYWLKEEYSTMNLDFVPERTIEGRIFDNASNAPIEKATCVTNKGSSGISTSTGFYYIEDFGYLSPTSITCSHNNYSDATSPVNVTGEFTYLDVGMSFLCAAYSITSSGQTFYSTGGTGSISVNATGGCSWKATSNNGWISITSGGSGSGNGTVSYTVEANTGTSSRTGTMNITGSNIFTVTQSGMLTKDVCGNEYGTWASGNTYNVTCDIVVPAGKSLIIKKGAIVNWNNHGITAYGQFTWGE